MCNLKVVTDASPDYAKRCVAFSIQKGGYPFQDALQGEVQDKVEGEPAGNAAVPAEPIQEEPTLRCLGVRWLVGGDENGNARIADTYRRTGDETSRSGLDLFRVETAGLRKPDRPPTGQTMFAGSIFGLEASTEYDIKLSLSDPDGGNAERIVRMKTWAEPRLSPNAPTVEVYPRQLAEALLKARPGQVLRHGWLAHPCDAMRLRILQLKAVPQWIRAVGVLR